mmetsp:Transcript_34387/g.82865  ORF Transcript_34387/g.82865 Transcript_34387/m.82865 type:complete len:113 (-) Transcript_34387:95-433(-)
MVVQRCRREVEEETKYSIMILSLLYSGLPLLHYHHYHHSDANIHTEVKRCATQSYQLAPQHFVPSIEHYNTNIIRRRLRKKSFHLGSIDESLTNSNHTHGNCTTTTKTTRSH